MSHLSEPMAMDMKKKKGPFKVRRIQIRCLDDGAYVVNVGMEDGNGNYDGKEYAYEDKNEMIEDITDDFLGGSSKKGSYLSEKEDD